MSGNAGSKLAGVLRDNYGFLIGGGSGGGGEMGWCIQRVPSATDLQDGACLVMKRAMGMWLAIPAGNNGLSHRIAFFPLFLTKLSLQITCFWETKPSTKVISHCASSILYMLKAQVQILNGVKWLQ